MATNRARRRVQNVYTWQKIINGLPYVNGRKPSLRTKAKAINDAAEKSGLPGRVTFADVERLEQGREPKGKAKREALGLPAIGVGVLCAYHGKVCATQHRPPDPNRPKRPRPGWGRKPLNTVWPVTTLEW